MKAHPSRRQQGLSLVELLVGATLGLITVLVISQVFLASEGQKRTTSSGSDAQVNGTLGLYAIQRDTQMAGYGLTDQPDALGCSLKVPTGSSSSATYTLTPARITVGSGATPDSITLLQSNKPNYSVPMKLSSTHTQTDAYFQVASSYGTSLGDLIVAVPATQTGSNWCTLMTVATSSGNTLTSTQVPHAAASAFVPTAGYESGSYLINLGSSLFRTYSVNASKSLISADLLSNNTSNTMTVAPQVVQLKALYGKDTNSDGTIDAFNAVEPTTNTEWKQVVALRVAVVVQSAQFESSNGSASTITPSTGVEWVVDGITTGAVNCTADSTQRCIRINVSGVGTGWQSYRYKVFDTVIPIRNIMWTR